METEISKLEKEFQFKNAFKSPSATRQKEACDIISNTFKINCNIKDMALIMALLPKLRLSLLRNDVRSESTQVTVIEEFSKLFTNEALPFSSRDPEVHSKYINNIKSEFNRHFR